VGNPWVKTPNTTPIASDTIDHKVGEAIIIVVHARPHWGMHHPQLPLPSHLLLYNPDRWQQHSHCHLAIPAPTPVLTAASAHAHTPAHTPANPPPSPHLALPPKSTVM
jgi:hypothetical protein